MRRVALSALPPDSLLAQPLYDARGETLLRAGLTLNERLLQLLRARGVRTVLVWNEVDLAARASPDQLQPPGDVVGEDTRRAAAETAAAAYGAVSKAASDPHLPSESPEAVAAALLAPGRQQALTPSLAARLHNAAEALMASAVTRTTLPGWTSLKTPQNYDALHGVETAAAAVVLGRLAGLSFEHLRQLALGCLLHDIGQAVLGKDARDALNQPGRLPDPAWQLVRQHPAAGFALLRQLPERDVLARTVALQHHERQDGGGYPRRIAGANTVSRDVRASEPGRLSLVGEIAAVADVYDALSSDRPHRTALPPHQVTATLRRIAGTQLNAELVTLFLNALPTFPQGAEVTVADGRYRGCRGVVHAVPRQQPNRPIVRLVRDAADQPLAGADVDIDLEAATLVPSGE